MRIIKQIFTDFNVYNSAVPDWQMEYNILSQKDFRAELNMYVDDSFALSRITLKGKLTHSGSSPLGYKSFVIPINRMQKYVWFNKGTSGAELQIFPQNCELNAVSFNNFDAYVLSIENNLFENKLKEFECYKLKSTYTGEEKEIYLNEEFANEFFRIADHFLTNHIKSEDLSQVNLKHNQEYKDKIIDKIVEYIAFAIPIEAKSRKTRKEVALVNAINIIKDNSETLFSVKELSLLTNISERSLEYAFKERYHVGPQEYLKSYRLNKVKAELFELKGQKFKISSIAGKYHFWHMGQFAKDFKKHFGILPSEV